ncbi:hypothetical protein [Hydrogenimonas cancrithermarum]|uniref:Uncharacterized protein n=1 Tax=Hydrogenimonas cancrithermarum TaxID=2993563 RepID=A0ABM8FNL8_9BACT|nr:hypothetical protein [Hydrogenimonas cancrithermarum]BDY13988.1 hypothetical protein HCR_23010 [Hydrogenimonas cancrithermarum]
MSKNTDAAINGSEIAKTMALNQASGGLVMDLRKISDELERKLQDVQTLMEIEEADENMSDERKAELAKRFYEIKESFEKETVPEINGRLIEKIASVAGTNFEKRIIRTGVEVKEWMLDREEAMRDFHLKNRAWIGGGLENIGRLILQTNDNTQKAKLYLGKEIRALWDGMMLRFKQLNERIDTLEKRLARMEEKIDAIVENTKRRRY